MSLNVNGLQLNAPSRALAADPASRQIALRDRHFPLLAKGINLAGWAENFLQGSLTSNQDYIKDADLALIKRLGFSHVRLPIATDELLDLSSPSRLNEKNYAIVSNMVQKVLKHNLAIVVDLHPDDALTKPLLATNDKFVDDYALFCKNLAGRLSAFDADKLFFEPLNEPMFHKFVPNGNQRWQEVQEKLIGSIREGAPNNTILVTSHSWNLGSDIPKMAPLSDQNVVYSVHYYSPMPFTHQGADWSDPAYAALHDVPYPVSKPVIDHIMPSLPLDAKIMAYAYGAKAFNRNSMAQDFRPLVDWAASHNAKLYLGEFGVYNKKVNPQDRARWIQDIRQLCERNGIGWAMWEYNQGFGLMSGDKPDQGIVQALGLNPSTAGMDPAKVLFRQRHPVNAFSNSSQLPQNRLPSAS